ncbi:RNA recognition motif-containing protein, partial [Teratosphaeriaceae sp. CCFEE 6253]
MRAAEIERKRAGKGIVRQAKVVFEGAGGSKVSEETGAGRSRGYGFIEYYTHRSALMGLRWLNGHAVGYRVQEGGKGSKGK